MSKIFDKARKAYEAAVSTLDEIAVILNKAAKKSGTSYDGDAQHWAFDVLLEYSMLEVALADEELVSEEVDFIKGITSKGSYIDFLGEHGMDVDWDYIKSLSYEKLRDLLNQSGPDVYHTCGPTLSKGMPIASKLTNKHYYVDFRRNVETIINAVMFADGEADESEVAALTLIYVVLDEVARQL